MRTLRISDLQGNAVGSISETDDGQLTGEGKGQSLLEQAPTKTWSDWIEAGHHAKYLRYEEEQSG